MLTRSDEQADTTDPEHERTDTTTGSKSRRTKFLQGAIVFVAMFAFLWWLLSRKGS